MKKLYLDNKIEISKKIRNRKATKVALIVILVLTLAMATGCGKKKNKTPTTPSTTVTKEETTPEVVEPTESTPVETVEPTETVPETEDVESIIENIDFSNYNNALECINDLKQYDALMLIVYNGDNGEGKKVLLDGDSYTPSESDIFFLNRSPQDSDLKEAHFKASNGEYGLDCTDYFYALPSGFLSGSYTIILVYNDGTEEEMTITLE